jgi:hypothetical protein
LDGALHGVEVVGDDRASNMVASRSARSEVTVLAADEAWKRRERAGFEGWSM